MTEQAASPRVTVARAVAARGVGLHGGADVKIVLRPAPAGAGVVFRVGGVSIPAHVDNVVETRLGVVLASPDGTARAATVEHLLAALAGREIDDLIVDVEGPEIPALDGSAGPYAFLLDAAGRRETAGRKSAIRVVRPVEAREGERFVRLEPYDGFRLDVRIDFPAAAVGRDRGFYEAGPGRFDARIARARTFAFAGEIEALRAAGFARGGTLANAVLVDGARVVNAEGLRAADEFVRHKILDCIGDLSLAGAPLRARVTAEKPGHGLNVAVLRALFADRENFRREDEDALAAAA